MAGPGAPRDAPRMFGRMSFVHGEPTRIDELIEFVTWTVKPATDRLAGNLGLGMWVNRSSGAALVMSVWSDEASLIASETAVTQLRDDGAAVMRGIATVERYETTLVDAVMPHKVGNVMRLVRMSCDPQDLDDHTRWTRDNVLPVMRRVPGYISPVVAVHRGSGAALVMSVWSDEASLVASESAVAQLRDDGAAVMKGMATVERYETALVDAVGPHRLGNVTRLVRMSCDRAALDEHLRWTRDNVVPILRRVPGYISHAVALDRGTGRAVSMSTYADGSDADIAYAATAPIRTAAANRGITILDLLQYEVALVGIRAVGMPVQRTIELPSETSV